MSRSLAVHDDTEDRPFVNDQSGSELMMAYGSTDSMAGHNELAQATTFYRDLFSAIDDVGLLESYIAGGLGDYTDFVTPVYDTATSDIQ